MTTFEDLFLKSKGQPVEYNGTRIQMVDRLPVGQGERLKVIFESAKTGWRQGLHMSTTGNFRINEETIQNAVVLWRDTAPDEVLVDAHSENGICFVKNVWDVGDGVMHSWHSGAAMIVEEFSSGRRYRCNDGKQNDDFDDLIFRIERVSRPPYGLI